MLLDAMQPSGFADAHLVIIRKGHNSWPQFFCDVLAQPELATVSIPNHVYDPKFLKKLAKGCEKMQHWQSTVKPVGCANAGEGADHVPSEDA